MAAAVAGHTRLWESVGLLAASARHPANTISLVRAHDATTRWLPLAAERLGAPPWPPSRPCFGKPFPPNDPPGIRRVPHSPVPAHATERTQSRCSAFITARRLRSAGRSTQPCVHMRRTLSVLPISDRPTHRADPQPASVASVPGNVRPHIREKSHRPTRIKHSCGPLTTILLQARVIRLATPSFPPQLQTYRHLHHRSRPSWRRIFMTN
jgi:hypothetical protein